MSFNSPGVLTAIHDLLASLTGVESAYIGAPESFSTVVSAYVTLGPQAINDLATSQLQRTSSYFCMLGYRTKGVEATAEMAIATAIDDLVTKFYAARHDGTGVFASGLVDRSLGKLDLTLAGAPDYRPVAGQEYRLYPFLIIDVAQLGHS